MSDGPHVSIHRCPTERLIADPDRQSLVWIWGREWMRKTLAPLITRAHCCHRLRSTSFWFERLAEWACPDEGVGFCHGSPLQIQICLRRRWLLSYERTARVFMSWTLSRVNSKDFCEIREKKNKKRAIGRSWRTFIPPRGQTHRHSCRRRI